MTLERAILTALNRAEPYLVPESSLLADVNAILAAPAGFTEMRQKLVVLECRGLVKSVAPDRDLGDRDRKYVVTQLGKTEVP